MTGEVQEYQVSRELIQKEMFWFHSAPITQQTERWEYWTPWPASWETCMQVRKQQLELDMEQQTASK